MTHRIIIRPEAVIAVLHCARDPEVWKGKGVKLTCEQTLLPTANDAAGSGKS